MNIPLLRQIQEKIKANPENFQMHQWHCGTTHCIAGWAVKLGNGLVSEEVDREAERLLGINFKSGLKLFHLQDWPRQFIYRTETSKSLRESLREAAQIACDRIDHFIATGGQE